MFPVTGRTPADLAAAMKENQVDTNTSEGGKAFLKFNGNEGGWTFGRDTEEVDGDQIVINSYSFTHGWALWCDGQVEKRTASFTQPLPEAMAPKRDRRGREVIPSQSRGFEARFLDEEDTILAFEGNSYGARQAVDKVLTEVAARAARGEERFLFPVCRLDESSYQSKEGKTVYNPVLNIEYWIDGEGTPEPEGGQQKLEQKEDAPAQEPAPEPEKEEPKQEEAPKRRRRRRAQS